MSNSTAEDCIRKNKPAEALQALKDEIRSKPADGRLRAFLFQLYCILGEWEKALTQLNLCGDMNALDPMIVCSFGSLLQAEAFRQEVFAGKRQPLFMGEPAVWAGKLVEALSLMAKGEFIAAAALRAQAFEEAPGNPGHYKGSADAVAQEGEFDWLADGDSRLGPCLEVVVEGKYYWLPLCNLTGLTIKKPQSLIDLVWAEGSLSLQNGGQISAYIPVRYPGIESSGDLLLARRTEWDEKPENTWFGHGQRLFMIDTGELPLLELQEIVFGSE